MTSKTGYKFSEKNYLFYGSRYENDNFSGYDYTMTTGIGWGHKFMDTESERFITEVGVGYKWAASVSYETQIANWNLMVNAIYGDNGDSTYAGRKSRSGNFYGLVVMPSTFIIEDKLEFVARYAYQGASEDEGIRTNSRYVRRDHGPVVNANIGGGRGDEHHSIYAGLNYYFCGHGMKVQAGVEHEFRNTGDDMLGVLFICVPTGTGLGKLAAAQQG